ncbi:hypothetical protein D915_009714 [Fasciola hepatica]|uniref:Uncharacterized protein n=1 Tax=Fasciola hepatica TaxID=6192 RepID=A0A4E0R1Y1_FASHE|nr:hypothetical protein D915_009714 [Fasciola hepatica]
MKRQTDLLGFFKAADKKLEISAPKFSSSQGANQFSSDDQAENVSGLTDTSIIGDTPNASRVCNVLQNTLSSPTFPVNKSDLDASKQLPTLQKRRGPAHRRSSLTVRRQAELLEKYQSALDFDGGPSNETAVERESRQANASAKLRRGKYDSLNYAPVDQITVSPISRSSSLPGEQRAFSHRSETLVNRALQASAKPRRPFSEITETLKADETLIKRLKPLVDQPKRCPPEAFSSPTFVENDKKTLTPSGLNNLNSEEMGALNEIMNLLEDDSASPKPVTTLTSRKIISKIKRRKIKPSINAVESPGIQKAQTTQFVKNISLTNSALDDSLTQLNLSNWSMNDSFGEL